jgi:hypothetical protein
MKEPGTKWRNSGRMKIKVNKAVRLVMIVQPKQLQKLGVAKVVQHARGNDQGGHLFQPKCVGDHEAAAQVFSQRQPARFRNKRGVVICPN